MQFNLYQVRTTIVTYVAALDASEARETALEVLSDHNVPDDEGPNWEPLGANTVVSPSIYTDDFNGPYFHPRYGKVEDYTTSDVVAGKVTLDVLKAAKSQRRAELMAELKTLQEELASLDREE